MRGFRGIAAGTVGLGVVFASGGCRSAAPKDGRGERAAETVSGDAGQPENTRPRSTGEMVDEEAAAMAREDQERAEQAGTAQAPVKKQKPPDAPMRRVTR